MCFPDHRYVSLEDPNQRAFAVEDPRVVFLPPGIIDANQTPGSWILTGSHNFQLLGTMSQTLGGTISVVNLSPFEYSELDGVVDKNESWQDAIFRGFYPEVVTSDVSPSDW